MCSSNKLVYEVQSIFTLLRNWTGVKFKTKTKKKKKHLIWKSLLNFTIFGNRIN